MSEATPCPEPIERLDPHPAVAVFAMRYPSEGEEGRTHDVALTPDGFWSCECFPWLEHDECKHVHDARARWYARRDCDHRLVVDERDFEAQAHDRICVFCGACYDRGAVLADLRAVIVERFRSRRRAPPSPWSGAERSADPS